MWCAGNAGAGEEDEDGSCPLAIWKSWGSHQPHGVKEGCSPEGRSLEEPSKRRELKNKACDGQQKQRGSWLGRGRSHGLAEDTAAEGDGQLCLGWLMRCGQEPGRRSSWHPRWPPERRVNPCLAETIQPLISAGPGFHLGTAAGWKITR